MKQETETVMAGCLSTVALLVLLIGVLWVAASGLTWLVQRVLAP